MVNVGLRYGGANRGFIRGPGVDSKPVSLAFHDNLKQGALLSVVNYSPQDLSAIFYCMLYSWIVLLFRQELIWTPHCTSVVSNCFRLRRLMFIFQMQPLEVSCVQFRQVAVFVTLILVLQCWSTGVCCTYPLLFRGHGGQLMRV